MPKKVISKKSKRRLMIFGGLSVFMIVYFLITLIGYLYNYSSLRQEEIKLKQELVSLQEEKANLKIEIQKLNDPSYIARYAKEKFLYSADGEYVIKIDTKTIEDVVIEEKSSPIIIICISCLVFATILFIIKKKART